MLSLERNLETTQSDVCQRLSILGSPVESLRPGEGTTCPPDGRARPGAQDRPPRLGSPLLIGAGGQEDPGRSGSAWLRAHHLAARQGVVQQDGQAAAEPTPAGWAGAWAALERRTPGACSSGGGWKLREASWDKVTYFIFLNGHYFILPYK